MAWTEQTRIEFRKKMLAKHGADYFARIGTVGGKAKVPKGFAINRELASTVGSVGGKISRRGKK